MGLLESLASRLRVEGADIEIKRFSPDDLSCLEKEGYLIYALQGTSIAQLKEQGLEILTPWDITSMDFRDLSDQEATRKNFEQMVAIAQRYQNQFLKLSSARTEVAFHPRFYLENCQRQTWQDLEAKIYQHSQRLLRRKGLARVRIELGGVADYLDLTWQHLSRYGQSLCGSTYGNRSLISNTAVSLGSRQEHIGIGPVGDANFFIKIISEWQLLRGRSDAWLAPLIVPA